MVKYEDIVLSPGDALDIYKEKYPDTRVKEIELKLDSASYIYEVEGHDDEKECEIYIDPSDGTILEVREKFFRGTHRQISRENTEGIKDMLAKALEDAGGKSYIHEWLLEIEDGILELKISVRFQDGQEIRYMYDLAKGKLINKV